VDIEFVDSDHYTFFLHELKPDCASLERVRASDARVAQSPEAFRKLKADPREL
jgi:hypothetical protein